MNFGELFQKLKKYPETWEAEDMTIFLDHLGLQKYSEKFCQ